MYIETAGALCASIKDDDLQDYGDGDDGDDDHQQDDGDDENSPQQRAEGLCWLCALPLQRSPLPSSSSQSSAS